MSNLLIEQIKRIHTIMGVKSDILLEASKLKILTDKEGLSEDQAKLLDELCGSLSVWMFGKIKRYVQDEELRLWGEESEENNEKTIKHINGLGSVTYHRRSIADIMDWVRVGLNGNVNPFKNLSLPELNAKSQEWHNYLNVGEVVINYEEKHPIIKDFRDENGNGFYWVDLETKSSPEECNRMGHCGQSDKGTLYSLRETKEINNKYKINKSHLTASIGTDGFMYQLKGPKNSKPKEEFHNYILPLFYVKLDDGYLVQGFGTEYQSQEDFKLSDLPGPVIRGLFQNRPDLFHTFELQKKLEEMGLIDKTSFNYNVSFKINASEVNQFINGNSKLIDDILKTKTYDLWTNDDVDWADSLMYYVDDKNESEIRLILKQHAMSENNDVSDEDFESYDVEDIIEDFDDNHTVREAIIKATINAESDDFKNHLIKNLKNALELYGTVEKMEPTGITIRIDLSKYFDELGNERFVFDKLLNDCYKMTSNGTPSFECVFKSMVKNDMIEKPIFKMDGGWQPNINRDYFNKALTEYLDFVKRGYGVN
jgi:hypothetical protein